MMIVKNDYYHAFKNVIVLFLFPYLVLIWAKTKLNKHNDLKLQYGEK